MEYPKLKNWNNKKLITRISKYWVDRVKIQNSLNVETMEHIKAKDLEEREEMNPNNSFDIGDKNEKNKILVDLINEGQQSLNWNTISPLICISPDLWTWLQPQMHSRFTLKI